MNQFMERERARSNSSLQCIYTYTCTHFRTQNKLHCCTWLHESGCSDADVVSNHTIFIQWVVLFVMVECEHACK